MRSSSLHGKRTRNWRRRIWTSCPRPSRRDRYLDTSTSSPRAFYASLLYLNAHNFGAIELLDQDEDMDDTEERLPVQDRFVSQWDLAIELPPDRCRLV